MSTLSQLLPQRSRLTLVKDQPGCLGFFVLLAKLKRAQTGQHPATILSTEHSKEHWMACAKKLGSPLSASTGFIDGLSQLADANEDTLENLTSEIAQSLKSSSRQDSPSLLLIDDLACLSWLGFADSEIEGFVKDLLRMAEEIDVDIVSIVHSPHKSPLLDSFATLTILTEPLSTGASAEVTGQIKAYRGPLWDAEDSESSDSEWNGWEKQLHLSDTSIQVKQRSAGNLNKSQSDTAFHYRRRRSSSSIKKLQTLSNLRAMERWDDRSGDWAMGGTDTGAHSSSSDGGVLYESSDNRHTLQFTTARPRQSRRLIDKHNATSAHKLSIQYAETILLCIAICIAAYKLVSEFGEHGVVTPAAVVVALSVLLLVTNTRRQGHVYGTTPEEYRDTADPGLAVALLLLPLMALSALYAALSSQRDGHTADWALKHSFIENPQSHLISSRRSLVGLSLAMSFTTAAHVVFTNFVTPKKKSGGRQFVHFTLFSYSVSTLITLVVALVRSYSDQTYFSDLDTLECFAATVFFQFTLLVISKLGKKGFTLGELVVSSGLGTGLFVEVLNLTRWKIGMLASLKTYRLPTPLVVLQLALIPGSFLIGFLLSPLLVLSRNISQKPLHRLRWPEQKETHRRILAMSFYILCAVLEISLVGMWLVWVLDWKNPADLIKEIVWNDGRYVRRLGLIGYWIALVAVSVIGWVLQLSRVRKPIQFKQMPPVRVVVEGGEIVERLMTAANKTAAGMTLNGRRKYFHLLLTAIIVPGVVVDPYMTHLAASVAFGIFIFIEYMRYFALYPLSAKIHVFMSEFVDEKDSGAAILSHFYLLTGSMMCLWMENGRTLDNLSGVLVLGVGDAMASIVGKKIGKHRWTRLSKKSVEGTIGFALHSTASMSTVATTARKKSINQQDSNQIEQPVVSKSQINRSPLQTQSVYQRCLLLRSRLLRVEGFSTFLDSVQSTNCVNLLWECFKLGNSLCHLFNQLGLEQQLEVADNYDINKQSICKKGVARFIISCKLLGETTTGWTSDDLFTVTDLYKQDTSGFIRVLHTVNLVVNELDKRGKLIEVTPTETDDAPILESTNQSRVKITQELIESERKFIMDMELLQSFSNEIRHSNIFSHDTHHSIFTNLNALVDFQRRVQISLEEAFEVDQSGGVGLWGKAFTDHEQDWLVYAPFVINYNHANKIVLEQAEAIQNGTPSGLSHYEVQALLIKPTQRVCKYHMFLDEIRRKTDADSVSHSDLTSGYDAMKRVTGEINELQRQKENVEKCEVLVDRVEDWKGHNISSFGSLLIEDMFNVNKNHVDREYHVFLFEKILLCCKEVQDNRSHGGADRGGKERKSSKSNSLLKRKDSTITQFDPLRRNIPLQLKGRIYLNNVTHVIPYFRDIQPGSHNLEVWWRGDDDLESFTLRCRTSEQLELWKAALEKQLTQVTMRRQAMEDAIARGELPPSARKQSTSSSTSHGSHAYSASSRRPSGQHSSQWPQTPVIDTNLISPMSTVSLEDKIPSPVYPNNARQQRAKTEDSNAHSFQQWKLQQQQFPPRSVSQQGLNISPGAERALRSQSSKSALRQTPAGAPPVPSVSAAMAKAGSLASHPTQLSPTSPHTRNRSLSSPHTYQQQNPFDEQADTMRPPPMPHNPISSQSMHTVSSNSSFVGLTNAHQQQMAAKQQQQLNQQQTQTEDELMDGSKVSLGAGSYSEAPTQRSWVSKRFSESSTMTNSSQESMSAKRKVAPISTSTNSTSSSLASSPNNNNPPTPTNYSSGGFLGDKMKVKVRYNEDLFVLNLPPSIDHSSLVTQIARKVRLCTGFRSHLPYSDNLVSNDSDDGLINFKLKWIDEEGDQILVLGDEDVGMAMDWARNQGGGAVELIVT
ncbi:hypothetical protein E3P99_00091 [Wallemia hederae]|uniref:DH domain-containing protein n=1 Tax=Wallemia hederae TaxID=1540922 RepID=A0A4T0FXN2_9BASI|nr:hypothetical protein E3P99_00091 [Wallemia hederae]